MSTRIRQDGTRVIVVDQAEVNRQFEKKQWAFPRLPNITALPKDAFKTPLEYVEFALEHEYQHTLFPSVSPDNKAAYAANEEKINRAAAAALGRSDELYPATGASGFAGYRGGFSGVGKGTPDGDGKDKAMRGVVTAAKTPGFIGEISDMNRKSSTKTSLLTVASYGGGNTTSVKGVTHSSLPMFMASGKYDTGTFKVMLARNGSLSGKPLTSDTVSAVKAAAAAGAEFVVGDMPGVDSPFIDLLSGLGAKFEVYHSGGASRIKVAVKPVAEAPVAQTPASVASVNLHAQAKAVSSHEVIPELRRLQDYLIYGTEEAKRMGDAEAAAAKTMAKVLDHVADTAWGQGIPAAKDIASAAAGILDAMRYAEPFIFIGALRAMRRSAMKAGSRCR